MIDSTQEGPKHGSGDFHDAVVAEFADPERDVFGLLRVAYAPNDERASVIAVVCSPQSSQTETVQGEFPLELPSWEQVEVGPVRMAIEQPLERWSASLEAEHCRLDLHLQARTPPIDFRESSACETAGVDQYEQLCAVSGSATIGGSKRKLHCMGRRVHVWGAPDWKRVSLRRSLYYASAEDGVTILGARPSGADHDRDVIDGRLVHDGSDPEPLDDIRVSTVMDGLRRPDSAGIELHRTEAEEEFANRLAGEAVWKTSLALAGREHRISFFRWSLDGRPGWGSYQTVGPQ